jgi:hypothetical protein
MSTPQNRIAIIVDVDPQGRAAAGFARLNLQITNLNTVNVSAGASSYAAAERAGRGWSLASLQIAAAGAAVVAFGKKSIDASNDNAAAARQLVNSSVGVGQSLQANIALAERFRREFGLARADSQRLTAASAIFAQGAGAPDRAEAFTRGLANLAAARGIQQDKLVEIVGQLQAGIDEATDRLFGKNPSVIQAEYAASIGKTLSGLTDLEKRYALFEAVIRDGTFFNGAAATKLAETNGQIELAQARFSDLTATVGDAVVQNGAFNDVLQSTLLLLGQITDPTKAGQVQDAQQAANDAVDSFAGQFTIRIRQTATLLYGVGQFFLDAAGVFAGLIKDLPEVGPFGSEDPIFGKDKFFGNTRDALDRLKGNTGENDAARASAEDRLRSETVERVNRTNAKIIDAEKKANDRRAQLAATGAAKAVTDAAKAEADAQDKAKAEGERKGFERQREALQILRGLRTEAEGILKDIAGMVGNDNPFVRIFVEGDRAAELLEKRFALFGDEAIAKMKQIQAAAQETAVLNARLESQGKRSDLLAEAARLARGLPFGQISEGDQNRLDIVIARLDDVERARKFGAQGQDVRGGLAFAEGMLFRFAEQDRQRQEAADRRTISNFGGRAPGAEGRAALEREAQREAERRQTALQTRQFADLTGFRREFAGLSAEVQKRAQGEVDTRLIGLFNSLDERARRTILSGRAPGAQSQFAAAFDRESRRGSDAVRAAVERAQLAEDTIARIRSDVSEVQRIASGSNAPDRAAQLDKAIIARTRELSDAQLTPDLRRARINSLEREAKRESDREKQAADEIEKWQKFRDELLKGIDNLTKQVKDKNESAIVEIRNKSAAFVDEDLLGEKPKPVVKQKKTGGSGLPTGQ